jgi:hypothetical protein
MTRKHRLVLMAVLTLIMVIPGLVHAAVVGHFTLVEGKVDLLKQGKLPAAPAKVQDGVEPGDVIRTKSKSRAQLKFMDDTILTLAPESRVAVADYVYDQAQGQRRAVLRLFRGLVHTAVTRLLQVQEPNFIMETHTAVIGVRGTGWYTLLMPNFTSVYLVDGFLDVKSIIPQIPAVLLLKRMEFTQVLTGMQPQLSKHMTLEMLDLLKKMMVTGIRDSALVGGATHLGRGEGLPEFKLPVSPDQLPQPVIPPQVMPPMHEQRPMPPQD